MEQVEEAHEKRSLIALNIVRIVIFYITIKVLVWSNDPSAKMNHMLGTQEDFILTKYSK